MTAPWPYTLRELCWRSEALHERNCRYVGWLAYHSIAPWAKEGGLSVEMCNPMFAARPVDPEPPRKRTGLPPKLTESQKRARWKHELRRRRRQERGRN